MTLDNQLSNLSIGGKGRGDPVAQATLEGKAPTLGDVKQSLRVSAQFVFSDSVLKLRKRIWSGTLS